MMYFSCVPQKWLRWITDYWEIHLQFWVPWKQHMLATKRKLGLYLHHGIFWRQWLLEKCVVTCSLYCFGNRGNSAFGQHVAYEKSLREGTTRKSDSQCLLLGLFHYLPIATYTGNAVLLLVFYSVSCLLSPPRTLTDK